MARFQALLAEIRDVQTQIVRLTPYRDFGLCPNPAASRVAIEAAERRIGCTLPPSYRAFLRQSDGWPRFYDGAALLGTASLGRRLYEDLVRAAFEAAETPVKHLGPPRRREPRALIAFGADMQATTLFAFNPVVSRPDGELEVIAWVGEIGIRRACFADFLELVLELCRAEIASHGQAPAQSLRQSA
jgi:hypothetical protein